MPLPLIPIIVGGGAAWLLSKMKGGGVSSAPPPSGRVAPPVASSPATDVAGDVSDSEADYMLGNLYCYRDGSMGTIIQTPFFRQMWLPASRVKLSSITAYQWRLASYLLNGSLHRRQDMERLYIDYMADLKDQQAALEGNAIFAQVASIIPVVGGIISTAVNTAVVKPLSAALSQEAATLASSFQSLRVGVDQKNLDPPAAMLISPVTYGGDATWDLSVAPWIERGGVSPVVPSVDYHIPDQYKTVVKGNISGRWHMQRRLFACFQYGFMLPWVSDELMGPTLRDTINLRAPVYKAVATLSAMSRPDETMSQQRSGLYFYHAGVGVDIYGTIFPPTEEDMPLASNIAYEGGAPLPVQGPSAGGGSVTPTGAGASVGGDGCEFCPKPNPPGVDVVGSVGIVVAGGDTVNPITSPKAAHRAM